MSYQATAGLYVIFAAVVFASIGMLMLHFVVSYLRRREAERRNRVSELRRREKELISTDDTKREGGVLEDVPRAHRKKPVRERSTVSAGDRTSRTEELEPVPPRRAVHPRGPTRSARDLLRSRE